MEISNEVQPDWTTHFVSILHYGHKYDKTQEATVPHPKKLARATRFQPPDVPEEDKQTLYKDTMKFLAGLYGENTDATEESAAE